MFELCVDCQRAERELWPVYTQTRWCCRARWIWCASVSSLRNGVTLEHARRSMCEREKQMHPETWPAVRDRLAVLKGPANASEVAYKPATGRRIGEHRDAADETILGPEKWGRIN